MQAYTQRRLARLTRLCGILNEELALTLDLVTAREAGSGTRRMIAQAREFVEAPWGLWTIWGGYGNGKTLILQAVCNEMREAGYTSAYLRLSDLLSWFRDGFRDGSETDRYEYARSVQVLAIDEFDGVRDTPYAGEVRARFLDDRYRRGVLRQAHTLIAMNANPETLPGDIWDRLRDGRFRVTQNPDTSLRPAMR